MSIESELTVCICTRDRPDELQRAVSSVATNAPAAQIVVSDDGCGSGKPVAEEFRHCRWLAGPQRGLGANRNAAVEFAKTPWLLFLDDDARLGAGFIAAVDACLARIADIDRSRTILTGREQKSGVLVEPQDVDFLGFQRRKYQPGDKLHTVVINATVWPREMFRTVRFDERLLYGSDEVDLSYSALVAGYSIVPCRDAVNHHEPSPVGRDEYDVNAQVARLRVGTKRNWSLHRKRLTALAFAIVASLHLLASEVKRHGVSGIDRTFTILKLWLGGGAA